MIGKPIDEIEEEHLQSLVDSKVIERKTLEYKRALPADSKHDKREFLADVSSFANASGGDIIYGMAAQAGVPTSLDGLSLSDIDGTILRLENMARDGIRPRIPGIQTQPITLSNTNVAIVMRIPKSWASPHRVIYEGHDKFYSRSSNGKYPLDVDELRSAFVASETLVERLKEFRADRIAKVEVRETPVPMNMGPATILHLVPTAAFTHSQTCDIRRVASNYSIMPPINTYGWSGRYNIDGCVTFDSSNNGYSLCYTQLFRSGIIEAVNTSLLDPSTDGRIIPSRLFEPAIVDAATSYLGLLSDLGVNPPLFLFLTLIGVKGYSMALPNRQMSQPIDRDILWLAEAMTEDYSIGTAIILKPAFDALWNACGYPRSPNYNDEGEWAPRR